MAPRRYTLREDAFASICDEHAAYWYGFIAADGTIKQTNFRIALTERDAAHLEALSRWLDSNAPVKHRVSKTGFGIAYVTFNSARMAHDLRTLGLTAPKSAMAVPTCINRDLLRHWLRGLFDGDGHVGSYTLKKGRRKGDTKLNWRLECIPSWAEWIQTEIADHLGISRASAIYSRREGCKSVALVYSGRRQITRICEWLYQDCAVSLDRKHQVVSKVVRQPALKSMS